jgi:hypothetical protein
MAPAAKGRRRGGEACALAANRAVLVLLLVLDLVLVNVRSTCTIILSSCAGIASRAARSAAH